MIKGVHSMFYSPHAEELRGFFRDVLEFEYVDAGGGWLIFKPSEAEIGFHPADAIRHEISLYCDDIDGVVEKLKGRGVEFPGGIQDRGYGKVAILLGPGGLEIQLYQPAY